MASRLLGLCAGTDLVARIGGDEFAVLMTTDRPAAEEVAGRIVAILGRPIEDAEHVFQLGASVGIAFRADAEQGSLFARADTALYAAKAAGRNTFRTYVPTMMQVAERRQQANAGLRAALDGGTLDLRYAPRRRLADGRPCGFVALPSWPGADGRLAEDAGMLGAREDPALAHRLGLRVLETALAQAASWMHAGFDVGHVSIARAAAPLRPAGFAEMLTGRIAAHGLRPGMIEIEISETMLVKGGPGVASLIESLRAGGVRVALGDFGAGGASLQSLRGHHFDALGLDAAFQRDGLARPHDEAILEAAVRLARRLGLEVTASGIMTAADRDRLFAMGCTAGDGPWIGAPVRAAEAGAILRSIRRNRVA
jgi:predicted signal transduction protein with EAL and GGDEF domain